MVLRASGGQELAWFYGAEPERVEVEGGVDVGDEFFCVGEGDAEVLDYGSVGDVAFVEGVVHYAGVHEVV